MAEHKRRPGRPISTNPRVFRVGVALTQAERIEAERLANLGRVSIATVLRRGLALEATNREERMKHLEQQSAVRAREPERWHPARAELHGASVITLALGIPHTPWVTERVESFERLRRSALVESTWVDETGGVGERVSFEDIRAKPADVAGLTWLRVFDERASNKVWPRKLWGWALDTGASHLVQLQDDVLVSPDFWPTLRAMLTAYPDRIVGLAANHPLGPEVARQGRRWYRTASWLVGWAYVLPRPLLAEFVAWFDAHPELVAANNEDQLLNVWISETGRECYHPVPSPVDHDTSIGSTYGNDDHVHRRTTVTWRGYSPVDLASVDYWRDDAAPLLPLAVDQQCWSCQQRPIEVGARDTGFGICKRCLIILAGAGMGLTLKI